MKNKILIVFIVILLSSIFLVSCKKESIKVGMIGTLSGKQSQLSIDARNAITIAAESINSKGGVNGSLIELVVKDDQGSNDVAKLRHKEFIDEGVHLVLGHMTSNMSDALMQSQSEELLFLSPSISNEKLSNIDDFFLRTSPLTNMQGQKFIEYISETNYKNISVIYDISNADYSKTLSDTIKKLGESKDRFNIKLVEFDSTNYNLLDLSNSLSLENADCVLIIAQATDTAFISQKLKQEKEDIDLFSVSWSMTKDLINSGGKSVEGMHFIGIYHSKEKSKVYIEFENSFLERFGYQPSFISILSYDSFNMLMESLKAAKDDSPLEVKKSLVNLDEFEGLEEIFKLNEYGDSNRSYLIYELKNGEFIPLYE